MTHKLPAQKGILAETGDEQMVAAPSPIEVSLRALADSVDRWQENISTPRDDRPSLERVRFLLQTVGFRDILLGLELQQQAAVAARLERAYNDVINEAKDFDALFGEKSVLDSLGTEAQFMTIDEKTQCLSGVAFELANALRIVADQMAQQHLFVPNHGKSTEPCRHAPDRMRRGPNPAITCEQMTYRYLLKHAGRDDITVREIGKALDYSHSCVAKTKAWKGYQQERKKKAEQNRKRLRDNQGKDDDFIEKQ